MHCIIWLISQEWQTLRMSRGPSGRADGTWVRFYQPARSSTTPPWMWVVPRVEGGGGGTPYVTQCCITSQVTESDSRHSDLYKISVCHAFTYRSVIYLLTKSNLNRYFKTHFKPFIGKHIVAGATRPCNSILVKITFLYKLVAKKLDFVLSILQISIWKDRATVAW